MRIGDLHLQPISDGTFVARPLYFGSHLAPDAHPELFDRHGAAWLPLGCFLIRSGDRVVLVDAGLGPEIQDGLHLLVGGELLTGLRAHGVSTSEVTDVVCTHLHVDHVGWLFDLAANPIFPRATIWYGAGDFHHFVTGPGEMSSHIRQGFREPCNEGRLRPIDRDTTIAPASLPRSPPDTLRDTSASSSPRGRNAPCCSATPSPVPSSSTNRPGTPLATSTPPSPNALANASGASSRATTPSERALTSPNSDSGAYSPAPVAAGSRE